MSYHHRSDSLHATLRTLLKRGAHVGLGIGAFTPLFALANPTGGQVAAGSANISSSNGNTVVKQTSATAVINWQQFNIGAGQYVQFLQPSSSSVILNRVVGGGISNLFGSLTANGNVFLINPNGIFFGKGSVLDAQGFVASTLNISDSNFMAGRYSLENGSAAPAASIINQGTITAHKGGYVVLAGDYAQNDGLIEAPSGHVVLASGTQATLGLSGNSLVSFVVNQATLASFAGVANTGSLIADGGTVVMTADVANQLRATVVNNSGLVEAHGIARTAGGIYLTATGGNIENSGKLDADGIDAGTRGGDITLKTDAFTNLTPTSEIDTVGASARGGNLEVSGKSVAIRGITNIGRGGRLLMDPDSINIVSAAFSPTGATHGGSPFSTHAAVSIGTGFIDGKLNAGVTVTLDANLKISASATARANGITAPGIGNLTLKVGSGGSIKLSGLNINIGGVLTASGAGAAVESFGHITAKAVTLNAGSGTVILAGASGPNKSIKTTGDLSSGGVTINAGHITASGDIDIDAGGNLVLNGQIGDSTGVGVFAHNVTLQAFGDVDVERSIYAGANLSNSASTNATNPSAINVIAGNHVNLGASNHKVFLYAGGAIDVSGRKGVLIGSGQSGVNLYAGLDKSTSSANRNLTLAASSGQVVVHAKNGTLTSTGTVSHTDHLTAAHDVIISAGSGVTLQAGNAEVSPAASLSGSMNVYDNVIVVAGHSIKINTVTGDLNISAGSAKTAIANHDHNLKTTELSRVLLNASSGSIKLTASGGQVNLKAGKALITGTGTFSSITASVHDYGSLGAPLVNISGKDGVNLIGGTVALSGSGNPKAEGTIKIKAGAVAGINAGTVVINASSGDVHITGGHVDVQGGGTSHAIFNLRASASAFVIAKAGGVDITAGQNIIIHGGSSNTLTLNGSGAGSERGSAGAYLFDPSSGNIRLTATHGNVTVTSGKNQTVSAQGTTQVVNFDNGVASIHTKGNLTVSAGQAVDVHTAAINGSVHSISLTANDGNLSAGNLSASDNVTLTDKVGRLTAGNITAGGAITLTAGQLTGPSSNASSAGLGGSVSVGDLKGKSVSVTALRANIGSPSSGQLANIHVGNVTASNGGITLTATDQIGNGSFGGGNITVSGNLHASSGAISAIAMGNGHSAGRLTVTGNVTTANAGNVTLKASHAGSANGGSVSISGSINAAGNVVVSASHASGGSVGGYVNLQQTTGLKINITATNLSTWSGGSVYVNGNLHATGIIGADGITVTAHDVGCCSSFGGHITVLGKVTADAGDVTLTATNDSTSNAGVTAGSISGRQVKVTASANGGGSAITLGKVTAATATISAANGGSITLAGATSIAASVKASSGNVTITGGSLTTTGHGNLVVKAAGALDITANAQSVGSVQYIASGGNLSAAGISASTGVTLHAIGHTVTDHGTIKNTAGNIDIKGKVVNTRSGSVAAAGSATLSASNGNLSVGGVSANHILLKSPLGNISGNGVVVSKNSDLTITASHGSINFSAGTLEAQGSAEGTGHVVTLTDVGHDITAGAISAAGAVTLTAMGHTVTDHKNIITTGGNITVTANAIDFSGGSDKASIGSVSLTANNGAIILTDVHAKTGVTITDVKGNISAFGGSITASSGSVSVTAANGAISAGEEGFIKAGGNGHNVTLTAVGHDLGAGAISASNSVSLTAAGDTVNDAGEISALGGNVTITAKNINLHSGGAAAAKSVLLNFAASGGLDAGRISAGSSINISHTNSDFKLVEARSAKRVTLSAGSHQIIFDAGSASASSAGVFAGINATLTAHNFENQGFEGKAITLSAADTLKVNGLLGSNASHPMSGGVKLEAGNPIKLANSIFADGTVVVEAPHLIYTGIGHSFTISANQGILALDASIGSALAPVKYNVNLKDDGGVLLVQRDIFTGTTAGGLLANITLDQNHNNSGGVIIGGNAGNAVTLSTKGNLRVTGDNVLVGGASNAPSSLASLVGTAGKVSVTAHNIILIGSGATNSHGNFVQIMAGAAREIASSGTAAADTSVTIAATNNLTINAKHIRIRGGLALAEASGSATAANATADVTLSAGKNIALHGGSAESGKVSIAGGSALAFDFASGAAAAANATADVSLTAGGVITITGDRVMVEGGHAAGQVFAAAAQALTATAHADASLQATGNITLKGGTSHSASVMVAGGRTYVSSGTHHSFAGAIASGAGAVATTTVTANVGVTAGGALQLKGNGVFVTGGNGVGENSGSTAIAAVGAGAKATLTAQGKATLTAGAAGIQLSGASFTGVFGGSGVGAFDELLASKGGIVSGKLDGSVKLTTTGDIDIGSHGHTLVLGGAGAGFGVLASASGGTIGYTANAGVTLKANNVTIDGSSLLLGGGSYAGARAEALGTHGGHDAVTALATLSVTAAGNLTLNATGGNLSVRGGAAAVAGSVHTFHSGPTNGTNSLVGSASTAQYFHNYKSYSSTSVRPAGAAAFGTGATAKLTASAGVTLKAGGTLTLSDVGGSINLSGGFSAGANDRTSASNGGEATVTAVAAVSLTAPTVSAVGGAVRVRGGSNAGRGAPASSVASITFRCSGSGATCGNTIGTHTTVMSPIPQRARGAGAQAKIAANSSVTVNAATITLTGSTGEVNISGGGSAAAFQRVQAGAGGLASVSAKSGVSLAATTALTAGAGSNLGIRAGSAGAYSVSVAAFGAGAKALLNTATGVSIAAPAIKLKSAHGIGIAAADSEARAAFAQASSGGSAAIVATGNVSFTAVTGIGIALTGATAGGGIEVVGGSDVANGAVAFAGHAAKAGLTATADADFTVTGAGGKLTLSTGNHTSAGLFVSAGNYLAQSASAGANHGGAATLTATGNVNMTAPGAVTISTPHGDIVLLAGQQHVGKSAGAFGSQGGKGTLTASANLNVTGSAVSLKAGGNIGVFGGGSRIGSSAFASASAGGSANMTLNDNVSITATVGGITAMAGGKLDVIAASSHIGANASVDAARGGAKAAMTLNNNTLFSAPGAINLTAGSNIFLAAASGDYNGHSAVARANNNAQATFTENDTLTFTAGGAFTVQAGGAVEMQGAYALGFGGAAVANHTSAKATYTANGQLTVNAASVAISAGSSINVHGGEYAASVGVASANSGGSANLSANASVNITGESGVSLTLTGATAGHAIDIYGGNSAAWSAAASVGSHGGKAAVTGIADVTIKATAAGAPVTITAGAHSGAFVSIGAGPDAASQALASADNAGTAAVTGDASVTIKAPGALTINAGASGDLLLHGGSFAAGASGHSVAVAFAANGADATLTATADLRLSGTTVTLSAGNDLGILANGGHDASGAAVTALSGGVAKLKAESIVSIATPGALTVTAGHDLLVSDNSFSGSGRLATGAVVLASGNAATATLTGTSVVTLKGASVTLTATGGNLNIHGANSVGTSALVIGVQSSDHATMTLNGGVGITAATGAVTLKAGGSLSLLAGSEVGGRGAAVASNAYATVTETADASVTIKAATTFAAAAAGNLTIAGGSGAGSWSFSAGSFKVAAGGPGAVATVTDTARVGITAANIELLGSSVGIFGGSRVAFGAKLFGIDAGHASLNAAADVSLNATGNVAIVAKTDSLTITGGDNGFIFTPAAVTGVASGAATLTTHAGVAVNAGHNLTLKAAQDLTVAGGSGQLASIQAFDSGSATANLDASVSLKATGSVNLTATGADLSVRGGNLTGILADFFPSTSPSSVIGSAKGKLHGSVNVGATISAGSNVTMTAGGNLTVGAGSGELMNVGGLRVNGGLTIFGGKYAGGSANLAGNDAATVTAGINLTLTAGTAGAGDLMVMGLQPNTFALSFSPSSVLKFMNVVAVRGGSSQATAKVTFDGNATLSAKNDIIVSVAGDASVIGGIPNNVRADHTRGNVSLLGLADATLKAGHDVFLKDVTGSLTVVGADANGISAGSMLVDAHADSGTALAVGHADGLISAGHDIYTASSHHLGGDLNLEAGTFVHGVAIGFGTYQQAHASADAGLKAGNNVSLTVTGGLNILGGLYGSASASASSENSGERIATMQATANITAGALVSLTVGGDAAIQAGDGLGARVNMASVANFTGGASADVGVSIRGGTGVTLAVGGTLLVRGGSSDVASIFALGSSIKATATADANAVISATIGNVAITAVGGASFLGGSAAAAVDRAIGFNVNGVATARAATQVSAGGNVSITATSLTAAGGALAGDAHASSQVLALFHAVADAGVDAGVTFSGANVSLKATTGDLDLLGGSIVGSFMQVIGAVGGASANLNEFGGVKVEALANIKLTATAGDINIGAGTAAGPFAEVIGSGGNASSKIDSSVLIDGGGTVIILATAGDINVFAGNSAAVFGHVNGNSGDASLTVNDGVNIEGVGNVILKATAGDVNLIAGGSAGALMSIIGSGSRGSATATVDANVRIKSAATLTINAGGGVTVDTGPLASFSGTSFTNIPFMQEKDGGTAALQINGSVKLSGGVAVSINVTPVVISAGTFQIQGLVGSTSTMATLGSIDGSVDLNAPLTAAVVLSHLSPLSAHTPHAAVLKPIHLMSATDLAVPAMGSTSVSLTSAPLTVRVTATDLDTLQKQSLVQSLETLFAPAMTLQAPTRQDTAGETVSSTPATRTASVVGDCHVALVQTGATDTCLLLNH